MANNNQLNSSWLNHLANPHHDGTTQQIDDRFAEFETDNQMFIAARNAVHQARQAEDTAYKRYSGRDFASEDLKDSASRMQSQVCLCYAEAQPAFAR